MAFSALWPLIANGAPQRTLFIAACATDAAAGMTVELGSSVPRAPETAGVPHCPLCLAAGDLSALLPAAVHEAPVMATGAPALSLAAFAPSIPPFLKPASRGPPALS